MNSSEVRQHLATYADGELSPELREAVEAALARDATLRAEVERWQALRRCARRALEREPLPDGLAERLRTNWLAEAGQRAGGPRVRIYRFGLASLSVAAIVALSFIIWPRGAAAMPVDIDNLARIHRECALSPPHDTFQVAGDTVPAASAKIQAATGRPCRLPDLTKCGNYRLDGASECSLAQGVRAVHAYFSVPNLPDGVISVFAVERPIALAACGKLCERCNCGRRGYRGGCQENVALVSWQQGNHSYVLAGNLTERELVSMADAAAP
jgi:anti-sigma factor RsiW